MDKAKLQITTKFRILLDPNVRYRIFAFYGGRGGGKTQCLARCVLARINASNKPLRVLNLRELQNSIEASTYQVYIDAIRQSGLEPNYDIYSDKIVCRANGSEIIFKGIRGSGGKKTGQQIKSYEGFDICWIDEAQSLSKEQLDILLPTIRKAGSQLWFSFNRLEELDPVWVITSGGDDDVYLCKVNWNDNPFFTEALNAERLRCKKNDPENYDHIWEGEPKAEPDDFLLINKRIILKAQERKIESQQEYMYAPRILGVDPARYGNDMAVWYLRQGVYSKCLKVAPKTATPQLVDITIEFMNKYKVDMCFIDRGGEGGSVCDFVKQAGYKNICEIGFNDGSSNKRYANIRAEMYCKTRDWLDSKGVIEDDYELRQELANIKVLPKEIIQLEPKTEVKKRIGRSPGKADALALTFAREVKAKTVLENWQIRHGYNNIRRATGGLNKGVVM